MNSHFRGPLPHRPLDTFTPASLDAALRRSLERIVDAARALDAGVSVADLIAGAVDYIESLDVRSLEYFVTSVPEVAAGELVNLGGLVVELGKMWAALRHDDVEVVAVALEAELHPPDRQVVVELADTLAELVRRCHAGAAMPTRGEQVRRIEFRYLDLPTELPRARRMSFFLARDQVLARTKTVTRRSVATWTKAKPGDRIIAIEKGQGLRAGEGHTVLALLEVVNVRVELLDDITAEDCAREGFPAMTPAEFCAFYRRSA